MESVNSAIINLELLRTSFWTNDDFDQLTKKLKLMRTFFLCARNWIDKTASPGIPLFSLKDAVGKKLLNVPDPSIRFDREKCRRMIHDVLESIDDVDVEQQFNDIYFTLCDRSVQSSSSMRVEFIEYYDSLQENLVLRRYDSESFFRLIRDLGEKLTFLKNMICFVKLRGIEQRQLEELLIYSGYVGVKAAWVFFLFSFNKSRYSVEEKESMIYELLQMIKPVDSQIGIYLRALSASSSLAPVIDNHVMGDFVDSVLDCLWDVVDNCTCFMVFVKDQIQMFYDGLSFLRTILKKQQELFDELDEEIKDIVRLVVKDAGIVIFLLSQGEIKGGLTQELELALIEFQGRIELIKGENGKKYPAKTRSNVSRSNALCFVDILLENLKNQTSSSKIDSNSFATDRFETIKEDLVFLRSFLENTVEQCNQQEKLQSIWDNFVEVSYKVEFVVDCLLISDIPDYSSMLLDTIVEEIKLIKTNALEIDVSKYGYGS